MSELSHKTILIVISVVIIVVGLLLYFLFRKKSNSNSTSCRADTDCSDGQLCDAKSGNCIKCAVNQTLCGNICMNSPQQTCINGIIYDTSEVCDSNPVKPVICDNVKTQCDPDKKVCVDCPKGRELCSGVCCPDNNFCDSKKCSPCATGTFVCGNKCCNTGDKCSGGNANYKCCADTEICGGKCCDSKSSCTSDHNCCLTTSLCINGTDEKCLTGKQVCTVDGPCDPDNVYTTKDSIKHCCLNPVCNNICCNTGESCDSSNTCKIKCGNAFCTPDTEKCITDDTTKKSYCLTNGCVWDEFEYYPPNILYGQANPQQQLEVCKDVTGNLWATYNANLTKTSSDLQSTTSTSDCQLNDCVYRSSEKGSNKSEFDGDKKTCNTIYDCSTILQTTLTKCPLDNPKSCCTDANGKLTGQVCPDSQSCSSGLCTNCIDDKQCNNGKCSKTITDTCDCNIGYDPSTNCAKCLTDVPRDINNNCMTGPIASFNFWCSTNCVDRAVLINNTAYIYGYANSNDQLFGFNQAITNFKKIIFIITCTLDLYNPNIVYTLYNGWGVVEPPYDNCSTNYPVTTDHDGSMVKNVILDTISIPIQQPMSLVCLNDTYTSNKYRIDVYLL